MNAGRASGGRRRDATPDAVVVGAGIVGASCALALARAGLDVAVVDRAGPAAGTSSRGEGNLLVSDKGPGPELELARRSLDLWHDLAARLGKHVEFEAKGGLVTAEDGAQLAALRQFAAAQASAGVAVDLLDPAGLADAEPLLAPDLAGGAHYPADAQLQPMQATTALLAEAGRAGADVRCYTAIDAVGRTSAGHHVLDTSTGRLVAPTVVVAAGPWSGEVATRFGGSLPVRPRRGHVLVTEPIGQVVRHKVYAADYVGTVASDGEGLQCSPVVEGTGGGTVLVGSSRELVGFDRTPSAQAMARLAAGAVRLFPFLARVRAMRCYLGFRPAAPDHLPVIGADGGVEGLYHASGHEGAGIGLAPGTAELLTALITGAPSPVDPAPFAPERFAAGN